MPYEMLQSTTIAGVEYDPEFSTLDVLFRSGASYRYFGVPQRVYQALIRAESAGRYLHFRIKPRFRYAPLTRAWEFSDMMAPLRAAALPA